MFFYDIDNYLIILLCYVIPGLPLLFKTKIQGQFKVFANILPRIQGFCTFSRYFKLSNLTIITIFSLMADFHKEVLPRLH